MLVLSIIVGDYRNDIIFDILLVNQEAVGVKYFNPLWFLFALFIMRIVSSIFSSNKIIFLGIVCFIIASILYYFKCFAYNNDYFQLCTTLICYPFFTLGNYIRNKNIKFQLFLFKNKIISIITFLIVGAILLFIGYYNGNINVFRASQAGNNIVIFYVVGVVLSYHICLCVYYQRFLIVKIML